MNEYQIAYWMLRGALGLLIIYELTSYMSNRGGLGDWRVFPLFIAGNIFTALLAFQLGEYVNTILDVGMAIAWYLMLREKFGPPGELFKIKRLLPRWAK